ncbi:MAG: cytochrome b/b6 domain-containing protein [Burkholderiales bacterium]
MGSPAALEGTTRQPVWDLFVRVFHWSLVACVLLNYSVVEEGEWLHQWLGYTASALVVARLVWGFVGSRYARFADFFPTPTRLRMHWAELRSGLRSGRLPRHVGHSPFGALMMLTLMLLVLLLGFTGWLQTTDRFWGVEWLQEVHEVLANVLITGAAVHAASALLLGRLERSNLVAAMISGVKVFK